MTLKLPVDIAEAVEAVSRSSGISVERLVTEALRAHFPPVEPELQADFEFWERASTESMATVDRLVEED